MTNGSTPKNGGLSGEQIHQFLEKGYLLIQNAFPSAQARLWTDQACLRIGYNPRDPKTWKAERPFIPSSRSFTIRDFTPKAWGAICALVGGEDRIDGPGLHNWLDSFIAKFPVRDLKRREKLSIPKSGWHKDGGPDNIHFLDSADMGLLILAMWSDVKPNGGGTFLACDSIGRVADALMAHPEGMRGSKLSCAVRSCRSFVELTGKAGDVALLHPYMIHAESDNTLDQPRFQSPRMVKLRKPLNFKRAKTQNYSLVELAVLKSLGLPRLDFLRRIPE